MYGRTVVTLFGCSEPYLDLLSPTCIENTPHCIGNTPHLDIMNCVDVYSNGLVNDDQ